MHEFVVFRQIIFVGQRFPKWGGASPQAGEMHEEIWYNGEEGKVQDEVRAEV